MGAVEKLELLDVETYLLREEQGDVRHEYLNGVIYAMAGAKNRHNAISTNAIISLGSSLRGSSCRPTNSDTKIRVLLPNEIRFYYPDAMVVCDRNPDDDNFEDRPVVIIEVLSEGTRRTDLAEKREAYLQVSSLRVLIFIEQDFPKVMVDRRGDHGFESESYSGLEAVIPLPEVEIDLPLARLYEDVEFSD
ncbi:MAG: Uma2 family endonuclease [Verrucomicrobiota bacterium]